MFGSLPLFLSPCKIWSFFRFPDTVCVCLSVLLLLLPTVPQLYNDTKLVIVRTATLSTRSCVYWDTKKTWARGGKGGWEDGQIRTTCWESINTCMTLSFTSDQLSPLWRQIFTNANYLMCTHTALEILTQTHTHMQSKSQFTFAGY